MRPFLPALGILGLLAASAKAGDLRHFEDATLHAVQFVNKMEGWAVGDEGVVWKTIDGGKNWERQSTGTRASLRSIHFLDPLIGWAAGREELPLGAGSAGVLLFTGDGGERWQRVNFNDLPGLNHVRFVDAKTGYALGDGSDQFPTGVFVTKDGGKKWSAVPGDRASGWLAGQFTTPETGALVGRWNRLASVRDGRVVLANVDSLGGRSVRGLFLGKPEGKQQSGAAVGQGGLLLLTGDGGATWSYPELLLPTEALSCWDLHAVHGAGSHLWAAGRPGSVLLHSGDNGRTWEMQTTGQPLPINGIYFNDEKHGWAVGSLGVILATVDGGKTWKAQQQGGKRSSVLFLHARATGIPADAVARLGGDEGYLAAAVRVLAADPATAPLVRAGQGDRLAAALRQAGGAGGESLWPFGVPAHLEGRPPEELVKHWDMLHGGKASEQMLRQLVLAIRLWRPDVIVTDTHGEKALSPAETVVGEAVNEAFKLAADPKAFPEQAKQLGLAVWKPSKLYRVTPDGEQPLFDMDQTEQKPRLDGAVRDFAAPSAGLLAESVVELPRKRGFRLVASNLPNADKHRSLMEGVPESPVGEARRQRVEADAFSDELLRQLRARATLRAISETPLKGLTDPNRLLGVVGPMLKQLPDQAGAAAAHALASQFNRQGQWYLAREAYLLMTERYPAHPLTADALRWLIRHNASSETRRRHEMGQFLVARNLTLWETQEINATEPSPEENNGQRRPGLSGPEKHRTQRHDVSDLLVTESRKESLRWYQGALDLESKLAGFGPLLANEPSMQFCLQAAQRNVGKFEEARKWCADFAARQPEGPWREAALAELWLTNRQGVCPKPLYTAKFADTRPFLDGKFEDACWEGVQPMALREAVGQTAKGYSTKVMLSHDRDFLYLALRCEHPTGKQVPTAKGRSRDAEMKSFDRISLMLDLDRDYATCFHLQVDQRGCVREDCWGDGNWNPRWFVAAHSEPEAWQIEAAIPLTALTGDAMTPGKAWACNLVRVVPGHGVQAWSLPAGVPEDQPRLEGMGLLTFQPERREEAVSPTAPRMQRVP